MRTLKRRDADMMAQGLAGREAPKNSDVKIQSMDVTIQSLDVEIQNLDVEIIKFGRER